MKPLSFLRVFAVLLVTLLPLHALNADQAPEARQAEFDAFLNEVRAEAIAKGFNPNIVNQALAGLTPLERVVKKDRKQAEFVITFETYRDRLVTPGNVAIARRLANKHKPLLQEIAAHYGVQPRFILAIWGMESRFGAIKGNTPLVQAVATLAFDKRRSKFFRGELMAALEMLDRGYITLEKLKGSWAGAMGQPQFIPTSYLAYAVDWDGDGLRDIWDNEADVFASIANYLKRHGWSDDQTWGREVRVPKDARLAIAEMPRQSSGCRAIKSMTEPQGLRDWNALGVRRANGTALPGRNLPAAFVQPDGADGPSFLVYRNYKSVLRYNCAHLYGLTIGVFSDKIAGIGS